MNPCRRGGHNAGARMATTVLVVVVVLLAVCVGADQNNNNISPYSRRRQQSAYQRYHTQKRPPDMGPSLQSGRTAVPLPSRFHVIPNGHPSSRDAAVPKSWQDGAPMADCLGVAGGSAVFDACGKCAGDNSTCADCAGTPNGRARFDICGTCCMGKTGVKCGSAKDACGVCHGDNSTCADCAGIPHGKTPVDCAGVCMGNDTSCVDCHGIRDGTAVLDACGVCDGDNSTCLDCRGVPNGHATLDACGVCAGDNQSCADCTGTPHGSATYDACGVCNGDDSSCCTPPGSDVSAAVCHGHGFCSRTHSFCECYAGWTGPFCGVEQDLCPPPSGDLGGPCGGRGTCNPKTGDCACEDGWMGPGCVFSTCSGRGAYTLDTEECHCIRGYGGAFCEKCQDPARLKKDYATSVGSNRWVSICALDPARWLPLPHGASPVDPEKAMRYSEKVAKGEEGSAPPLVAPMFILLVVRQIDGNAYVKGRHAFNGEGGLREAIWPNSVHNETGYYYDCACQLANKPVSEEANETAPDPWVNGTVVLSRTIQSPAQRAATLGQFRSLTQAILNEYSKAVDTSTADADVISDALNDIIDGIGSDVSVAMLVNLGAWFLFGVVIAFVILLVWVCSRYCRFTPRRSM